jgi:hypothetical protein
VEVFGLADPAESQPDAAEAWLRGADIHVCGIATRLDAFPALPAFVFLWNSRAFRTTGIETSLDAAA